MEGPQFSSLAESELYRTWNCDVIGMTNMPKAKLVCCPTENFAKTLNFSEDGFGRRGPHEGTGVVIPVRDEVLNAAAQVGHGGERASTDRALGDQPEPAFDLVEPGTVGREEVQLKAHSARQPRAHLRVLVGAVVVDDEMHVERAWNLGLEMAQEREELLMAMARLALSEDLAVGHVE